MYAKDDTPYSPGSWYLSTVVHRICIETIRERNVTAVSRDVQPASIFCPQVDLSRNERKERAQVSRRNFMRFRIHFSNCCESDCRFVEFDLSKAFVEVFPAKSLDMQMKLKTRYPINFVVQQNFSQLSR